MGPVDEDGAAQFLRRGRRPSLPLSSLCQLCGAWTGELTVRELLSAGTLPPFRGNSGSCSWFAAGPSFLPQWARDLDGQQAPRPGPSANSNRLPAVPGPGGPSRKDSLLCPRYTRRQCGGTGQDAPEKGPAGRQHQLTVAFPPQKFNADYDLSARQGADTLAFMSLLEEKLLPVLVSAPRPPRVAGQWGRGQGHHRPPQTPQPHPLQPGSSVGIRSPP